MKKTIRIQVNIAEKVIQAIGSLGITRDQMPQIDGKDHEKFFDYLKEVECDFESCDKKANQLRPSQSDLDTAKADKIWKDGNALTTTIFISQDDYVLDGHHRWLAAIRNQPDAQMKCIKLGHCALPALDVMRDFEHSSVRDIKDNVIENMNLSESILKLVERSEYDFEDLKKNKKPLSDEEREIVMKADAVWHHGSNGEPSPAVSKAEIGDKTIYFTATHRAFDYDDNLEGAIKKYHDFIKETA